MNRKNSLVTVAAACGLMCCVAGMIYGNYFAQSFPDMIGASDFGY
jgi:hypothetical protein